MNYFKLLLIFMTFMFKKKMHQSDGRKIRRLELYMCVFTCLVACPVTSMDVLVPQQINALNGTNVRIPCAFTSCYKLDPSKFAMNWTYQETLNSTEEMVRELKMLNIIKIL